MKKVIIGLIIFILLVIAAAFQWNKIKNNMEDKLEESTIEDSNEITKFKVDSVNGKENGQIEVSIELLNDSNFVAANFEFEYDGTSIAYEGYVLQNSVESAAMKLVNNDKENSKILMGFVADPTKKDKTFKAGKMITLNFKIKSKKEEKINPKLLCTTLKDENGGDIKFNIEQGSIEIE